MSSFKGGWFIEVEDLEGNWVRVVWSPRKRYLKGSVEALNEGIWDDPFAAPFYPWARLTKNEVEK